MTDHLSSNLDEATRLISDTLLAARHELEELDLRREQLLALIARTESMQHAMQPDSAPARQLTLHEAMAFVIEESSNRWMTIQELARAINKRGLYRKRDGSPVEINQLHARINNYSHLFDKDGPRVRLHSVTSTEERSGPSVRTGDR